MSALVVVRAITAVAGLGLLLAGLYAAFATFGALLTLAVYAVVGLVIALQYVVLWRLTCSPGA